MDLFFEDIKKISDEKNKIIITENENQILLYHIQEISELILSSFKENVLLAAEKGCKKSTLFVFTNETKYRNIIDIKKLLFPTEYINSKLKICNELNLLERIRKIVSPFTLEIESFESQYPEIICTKKIYSIVIYW